MKDASLGYAVEPQPFVRALKPLDALPNAVLRGGARADCLRTQGFAEGIDKGLEVGNVSFRLIKMHQVNRIDLIVFSDEGLKLACKEALTSCDNLVPAFKLDIVGNLWLAASPRMASHLVNTLRQAYQRLGSTGYLGQLMKSGFKDQTK